MRVLVTTPDFAMPGGVGNYFGVLRPFLENVAEYHTVGRRSQRESWLRSTRRLVADYTRFVWRMAKGSYDLVHLNPSFALKSLPRDAMFLLIAKLFGCPVLVFIRGWDPDAERRVALRFRWLFRLVYGRADAFLVLAAEYSRRLRELGYRGFIEQETTVASNAGRAAARLRERQPNELRILFLARVEKAKGIYELIEAIRRIRARCPQAELVIAGDGAERERAQEYVVRAGADGVRFTGHVTGTDKIRLYEDADVFVLASYAEGMPNSVLEAMAQGLPVITRPVGGIADFFEDGVMGFLTESLDPGVYEKLLERIMREPQLAARMGEYNRRYAAHTFSAETVATRLLAIYERVIAGAGTAPGDRSVAA